jgi:putative ABC transport system permease protein
MQGRRPLAERAYRRLMTLLPKTLRSVHGEDMARVFSDLYRDACASGLLAKAVFLTRAFTDLVTTAVSTRFVERERDGEAHVVTRSDGGSRKARTAVRMTMRMTMTMTWKHDVAVALRLLAHSPSFAGFAVLTMALGIGANIAIFSAVYGVLLRPLGLSEPAALNVVRLHRKGNDADVTGFSPRYLRDLDERLSGPPPVGRLTSYIYESVTLSRDGEVDEIGSVLAVAANFFEVMGVRPILGRTFSPEDMIPNQRGKVCVIDESFWLGRLGGAEDVIGTELILDEEAVSVVGVIPSNLPLPDSDVQLWIPQSWDENDVTLLGRLLAVARLSSGGDTGVAQPLFSAAADELAANHPRFEEYTISLQSFRERLIGRARPPLVLATVAVGLILLIACANTANLLLSRAAVRAREMATRRALGAHRAHVLSQLVVESLTLAVPGGVIGVLMALGLHRALLAVAPSYLPRLHDVRIDLPVLVFAALVTVLSGFLFGLAPVAHTFRFDLVGQMSGGAGGGAGLGESPPKLSRVLVAAQLGLAVALVMSAALMVKSLSNLRKVNQGFQTVGVGAARIYLDDRQYVDTDAENVYFRSLLEQLRSRGDIEAAGASSGLPLDPYTIDYDLPYTLPGEEPERGNVKQAFFRTITPGYVEAMRIPLVAGRAFDETDRAETRPVALVNESFANAAWPSRNPVGGRFFIYGGRRELLVVGVVRDVRFAGPAAPYKPEFYVPHSQAGYGAMTVVARSKDAATSASAIAEEAIALNPQQPVNSLFTLEELRAAAISTDRFLTLLLVAFAAVALMLSAAGVYGVISYWVSRSRRELGVRMAFGASGADVLRLVVTRALSLSVIGLLLGLGVSLLVSRLLARFLFEVGALEVSMLAGVAVCFGASAVVACVVPGLRASRLDPMSSLRLD